jgi:hypothetical protein
MREADTVQMTSTVVINVAYLHSIKVCTRLRIAPQMTNANVT